MEHQHSDSQPDYGTGHKNLRVYVSGLIGCILLTIVAFWAVMANHFSRMETFTIIYTAACVQFVVQIICFLRLNAQNEKARTNVMTLLFTLVILVMIILGSLWIMWNINYYMM